MTSISRRVTRQIADDFHRFVPANDQAAPLNWRMRTLGGRQYWNDLRHLSGWRIQRNAVTGHFRLLNPEDIRFAWGRQQHCENELNRQIRSAAIPPNRAKVVILLHGLLGSTERMNTLEHELSASNEFQVINIAYSSTQKTVAENAKAFNQVIENLGSEVKEIHFVAHSLGNIVIRRYIHDRTQNKSNHADLNSIRKLKRVVMLGPPNQGSRLANIFKDNLLFRAGAGVGGQELSNHWARLEPTLALPTSAPGCEFGIISGVQNPAGGFDNLLLDGKDDWTVSVAETRLAGATDTYEVAAFHGHMVHHPDVIKATERFLKFGYFVTPDRNPIPTRQTCFSTKRKQ